MMVFGDMGAFSTDEVVFDGRNVGEVIDKVLSGDVAVAEVALGSMPREVVIPRVAQELGCGVMRLMISD